MKSKFNASAKKLFVMTLKNNFGRNADSTAKTFQRDLMNWLAFGGNGGHPVTVQPPTVHGNPVVTIICDEKLMERINDAHKGQIVSVTKKNVPKR